MVGVCGCVCGGCMCVVVCVWWVFAFVCVVGVCGVCVYVCGGGVCVVCVCRDECVCVWCVWWVCV